MPTFTTLAERFIVRGASLMSSYVTDAYLTSAVSSTPVHGPPFSCTTQEVQMYFAR
jgi:hypothetical protein